MMTEKWTGRVRPIYRSRWALFKAILKGREPWRLLGGKAGEWKATPEEIR
jgi:hypothetical protein